MPDFIDYIPNAVYIQYMKIKPQLDLLSKTLDQYKLLALHVHLEHGVFMWLPDEIYDGAVKDKSVTPRVIIAEKNITSLESSDN